MSCNFASCYWSGNALQSLFPHCYTFLFLFQEDEEIGFGPFPASGLFKLLYHPNGTSVVLASLQYVVLAHKETNMLSLEGFLKKDADVKFVPKKAYFRIIQQRQGSNIFVLQSEINPSASMEVIFEPRHVFFWNREIRYIYMHSQRKHAKSSTNPHLSLIVH